MLTQSVGGGMSDGVVDGGGSFGRGDGFEDFDVGLAVITHGAGGDRGGVSTLHHSNNAVWENSWDDSRFGCAYSLWPAGEATAKVAKAAIAAIEKNFMVIE